MEDDSWTMEVTKLLLEKFDGRAKFGQVKSSLYQRNPEHHSISHVIRRLTYNNRFLVFKRNQRVKYVSVAWPDAGICFDYRNRGWDTCRKDNCSKFHVCKFFITGYCVRGSRCLFGHDLENEANERVSDSLGLSSFSAQEIRTILFRSHPAVCVKYNTGGCDDDDCPDLHVCSRFMLKKCKAGARCNLEHSLQTPEHNQWVLNAFDVKHVYDGELRRCILVTNISNHCSYVLRDFRIVSGQEQVLQNTVVVSNGEHPEPLGYAPAVHQELDTRQSRRNEFTRHLQELIGVKDTDPGAYEYLCETYTWTGVCPKTPNCPRYHSPDRLPYLWLTRNQEDGEWRRVYPSVNTDFGNSFCGLHDVISFQNVDFSAMSAEVDGVRQSVELRRLSTPSYVTATPGTPLNFYTQWVWYWQKRDGRYTPFYPGSLQYTLEEKYLKGQHKYYFEFKELRLMVDTQSSRMVQTNLDTQRTSRVIRRPVYITADTSKAPRMSSLLLSEVPTSVLHQVPDHWSAVDHFQDFELVELSEAAAEYIAVQQQFLLTMDKRMHKIARIFRVQNPGLWDKYCSARRAMTPRGQRPEEVEERQLFHGTPTLQAARGICANSFDFRRSGENVGAVWGKGAYFSTTSRYSHSYTRAHITVTGDPQRFMFLGRILVGQYTLGDPSYTKPPERDGLKMYDSCVNNSSDPTIFVIFDLAQSYPEYLIQYTTLSVGTQSQPRPRASVTSPAMSTTAAAHTYSTTCNMEHSAEPQLSTAPRPLPRTFTSSSTQSPKPRPLTTTSTSSSGQSAKPCPLATISTSSSGQSAKPCPLTTISTTSSGQSVVHRPFTGISSSSSAQSDLPTGSVSLISTSSSSQSSSQCQSSSSDEPFKSVCIIT